MGGGSVREGREGGSSLGGKVGGSQGGGCPVEGGGSSEEGTRLKGLQEPAETAGPATVDDVDNLQKRKLFIDRYQAVSHLLQGLVGLVEDLGAQWAGLQED